MRARLLTAVVGIALVVVLVSSPPGPLAVVMAVVAALGALELVALARAQGFAADAATAACVSAVLAASPLLVRACGGSWRESALPVIAGLSLIALSRVVLVNAEGLVAALPMLGTNLVALLWLGLGSSYIVALRLEYRGVELVFALLAAVWFGDSGALLVGRTLGRRKLAPRLSPGKTVAGAVGGIAFGLVALFAARRVLGLESQIGLLSTLVLGALVSVSGVVGDLVESGLKRGAGLKDSGRLFPGHGGILDRLDSLLFAAPVMYHFLAWTRAF